MADRVHIYRGNMTQPWNMAKAASKRPLPKKRKMHGPVSPDFEICQDKAAISINGVDVPPRDVERLLSEGWHFLGRPQHTCYKCGYMLCSCPQGQPGGGGYTYDVAGKAFTLTNKPQCIFCGRTGLHQCSGGPYTRLGLWGPVTGVVLPGVVDGNIVSDPEYRRT